MLKKILILFAVVVLILAVGLIFYLTKGDNAKIITEPEQNEVVRPPFPEEFLDDKDQDGLSAKQEEELGTSDTDTDTDGDGLSDYDEVTNWKTDPLKIDTDGDGFADYVEILNGHDPLTPNK